MTLENKAVKRISNAILQDVLLELEILREEYLKSKEFNDLVDAEIANIDRLLNLANEMGEIAEGENALTKDSTIHIGEYTFKYNPDLEYFEYKYYRENIENTIKIKMHLDFTIFNRWSISGKERYLSFQILGLVSTFDSTIAFEDAKKAVMNSLNLKEILFNKNI